MTPSFLFLSHFSDVFISIVFSHFSLFVNMSFRTIILWTLWKSLGLTSSESRTGPDTNKPPKVWSDRAKVEWNFCLAHYVIVVNVFFSVSVFKSLFSVCYLDFYPISSPFAYSLNSDFSTSLLKLRYWRLLELVAFSLSFVFLDLGLTDHFINIPIVSLKLCL